MVALNVATCHRGREDVPHSHGGILPGAIMDLHLDTLGEDPTRLEFFALRYQQTANDQAAKIIGLEHQITFLTKQLEKERARKQDAPANGVSTSSNGANSLNNASGSSRRSRVCRVHSIPVLRSVD